MGFDDSVPRMLGMRNYYISAERIQKRILVRPGYKCKNIIEVKLYEIKCKFTHKTSARCRQGSRIAFNVSNLTSVSRFYSRV
jgi:hypothetical protein